MEEDERLSKIEECRNNIVSLVREWVAAQDAIDELPRPLVTECDLRKRQEIGDKLLSIRSHLKNEVKILDQVESAPNMLEKWEGEENDESDPGHEN